MVLFAYLALEVVKVQIPLII
jgi:hypothetical protein